MAFKRCSCCERSWGTRADFLDDAEVQLVGYQANFRDLATGILLFTHCAEDCGSTVAIDVGEMIDLGDGPAHDTSLAGTGDCHGHCLSVRNLDRCRARCRNAHVRELMHVILARQVRRDE